MKRILSSHVITRVYRPPEVILTEREYHCNADIWSMGCCAAELIWSIDEYRPPQILCQNDKLLFKGTSCFPLSPCNNLPKSKDRNKKFNIEETDQLRQVLDVLGKQDDEDLSFVAKSSNLQLINENQS
jgi:mitogen-activated protein kinase 1/3